MGDYRRMMRQPLLADPFLKFFFCEPPRQATVAAVWESINDSLCPARFFRAFTTS